MDLEQYTHVDKEFPVGYPDRPAPDEGRKTQQSKRCEGKDNTPHVNGNHFCYFPQNFFIDYML